MTQQNTRVYEVAGKLGIDIKLMFLAFRATGADVQNHMSIVSDGDIERAKRHLEKRVASGNMLEDRIRPGVVRRRRGDGSATQPAPESREIMEWDSAPVVDVDRELAITLGEDLFLDPKRRLFARAEMVEAIRALVSAWPIFIVRVTGPLTEVSYAVDVPVELRCRSGGATGWPVVVRHVLTNDSKSPTPTYFHDKLAMTALAVLCAHRESSSPGRSSQAPLEPDDLLEEKCDRIIRIRLSRKPVERIRAESEARRRVRPHTRRGHTRMQHVGPGKAIVKQVQVKPASVKGGKIWGTYKITE